MVAQQQPALFQAPQGQVIQRRGFGKAVDQVVQIAMFDAQFDQMALRRVKVVIH